MAEMKNGGPAFPCEGTVAGQEVSWTGMTLRDYFAAQSISAFALDMSDPDITFDDVAQNAYRLADAMLKAREAK
jgi:hypothetical protein